MVCFTPSLALPKCQSAWSQSTASSTFSLNLGTRRFQLSALYHTHAVHVPSRSDITDIHRVSQTSVRALETAEPLQVVLGTRYDLFTVLKREVCDMSETCVLVLYRTQALQHLSVNRNL